MLLAVTNKKYFLEGKIVLPQTELEFSSKYVS